MVNEDKWKVTLGNFLKEARQDKKVSAQKIADSMNLSQSQISAIEHGQRKMPTLEFIKQYLALITNSTDEYNFLVDELNTLADGKLSLKKIDAVTEKQNEINSLKINHESNNDEILHFDVPINDIVYHLTDEKNEKFFGRYLLSSDEKKHILEYIYTYLKNSKEVKRATGELLERDLQHQLKEANIKKNEDLYEALYKIYLRINGDNMMNTIHLREIENIYHSMKNRGD